MSKRTQGYYWIRWKDPKVRPELHNGWMPAFWVENGWTIIGTVVRSKDRKLEVGRKIEPNLHLLGAKKYRKPKDKREEGYYWVRMPNILSRSIPHESVHDGWEPAR